MALGGGAGEWVGWCCDHIPFQVHVSLVGPLGVSTRASTTRSPRSPSKAAEAETKRRDDGLTGPCPGAPPTQAGSKMTMAVSKCLHLHHRPQRLPGLPHARPL